MRTRKHSYRLGFLNESAFLERNVKIQPGPLAGEMSGSLGNTTFSRNKGGAYARIRGIPTNPNTPDQQAARTNLSVATQRWSSTLTDAQRAEWETYAQNVPVTDALGAQIQLSGQQHYVRSATARLRAGLSVVDDGPAVFNLGDPPGPSFGGTFANDETGTVTFDAAAAWCDLDGAAMIIYGTRPVSAGKVVTHQPATLVTTIEGDSVTPPTSPLAVAAYPFPLENDQKIALRGRILYDDGRVSSMVESPPIIVA